MEKFQKLKIVKSNRGGGVEVFVDDKMIDKVLQVDISYNGGCAGIADVTLRTDTKLELPFETKAKITEVKERTQLNFGNAIEVLKAGGKVARKGWNGKGMYVFRAHANDLTSCLSNNGEFKCNDSLCLKTAQDTITIGWVPSQSDMFAEDWEVVG